MLITCNLMIRNDDDNLKRNQYNSYQSTLDEQTFDANNQSSDFHEL